MSTQATYLTALDQFGDIAQAIDLSQDLAERGADIRDKIADFPRLDSHRWVIQRR